MLLEPGPVAEWPAVEFDLRVEPPEFEAAARALAEAAGIYEPELERQELALAEAVELGQADELAEPVGQATEALALELESAAADQMGDELAAVDDVNALLLEAFTAAPDEAWQDLPPLYPPWQEQGGFVAEPPPAYQPPVPGEPPPDYTPPAPTSPTVRIMNLTRPGAVDFRAGEEFQCWVTGPPYQLVTIMVWHDQIPSGPAEVGITDESGRFDLRGRMTQYEIGSWVEVWRVAGQECSPVLRFVVR